MRVGEVEALCGDLVGSVEGVFGSMSRRDQRRWDECYLRGLMLDGQRKSVQPMAARKNGAARQKPKRRTTTVVRRDGREPLGLGSAIGMMMTERGMPVPRPASSASAGLR